MALAPSTTTTVEPGETTRPTCSIIIPVHNKASLTRGCLNTILAQADEGVSREIIVVDDGSTDLTPRLLASYGDAVRVVTHEKAQGFARACNAGAAAARGDYLILLNNDTLPWTGWLTAIAMYANDHPRAAIVGAKLLYPNGTVQHAGVVFGIDRFPHHLYAGFPADHPAVNTSRQFQAVTAACCLIRRDVFDQFGGFDTEFLNGWEDVDLCLRLTEQGHEIHYCHECVVYHLESASRDLRAAQEQTNRGRYFSVWGERVRPDDLEHYAADGLLSITYTARHPLRFNVSPLLAGVDIGENEFLSNRLLQERARQIAILVRNNIVLNLRVQEAELKVQAAELRVRELEAHSAASADASPTVAPPDRSLTNAPAQPLLARPESAPADVSVVTVAAPIASKAPILGACERPPANSEVVSDGVLIVSGWVLSQAGIVGLDARIDGEPRGRIRYGAMQRPDVAALYPGYPDGEQCGFVGEIPVDDLPNGKHQLTIEVSAHDGNRIEINTSFHIDTTAIESELILIACDQPPPNTRPVVRDRLMVSGWALGPSGIDSIETLVDDVVVSRVAYGSLRPDVAQLYPEYPEPDHSGFIGSVPMRGIGNGSHILTIRAHSKSGQHRDVKGAFVVDQSVPAHGEVPHINAVYPMWLKKHIPSDADLTDARYQGRTLNYRPVVHLIVPIDEASAKEVTRAIKAIQAQTYDAWLICFLTGKETAQSIKTKLRGLRKRDPRVSYRAVKGENRASAINAEIADSAADYVGIMTVHDLLSPVALFEIARFLNEHPETDVLYTDEDKLNPATGYRWDPFFRPDWSPDLHLSIDYLGGFTLYRRSLVHDMGGVRGEVPRSESYDLALRASERTEQIHHLPRVLVSHVSDEKASGDGVSPIALASQERALGDAADRRGTPATVEPGVSPGRWRVRYQIVDQPAVTIVMPTGGKMHFLQPCLESLITTTTYTNVEYLLIDNSEGSEVAELVAALQSKHPDLRLHHHAFSLKPFNFSAIINHAIPLVTTPYLVLLNDDVTVISADWIEAMLEHAQRPEVGVVGAKLLFPDNTFQHAGVVLGPYLGTGHAYKQFPGDTHRYFGLPNVVRNCSAVTFACAMVRREIFDQAGLLDAENLPIAFNDVDMCLRIGEHGYRVVYTPHAMLYHHESVTKTVIAAPSEIVHLRSRWQHVIEHDPFYNPNLTRRAEDCSLNME